MNFQYADVRLHENTVRFPFRRTSYIGWHAHLVCKRILLLMIYAVYVVHTCMGVDNSLTLVAYSKQQHWCICMQLLRGFYRSWSASLLPLHPSCPKSKTVAKAAAATPRHYRTCNHDNQGVVSAAGSCGRDHTGGELIAPLPRYFQISKAYNKRKVVRAFKFRQRLIVRQYINITHPPPPPPTKTTNTLNT